MKKPEILGFALLAMLLTACSGAATVPPTEAEALEPVLESDSVDIVTSPPATCTAVSSVEPSEEASLFPEVSAADHINGPEDATVTILEYGDFQ